MATLVLWVLALLIIACLVIAATMFFNFVYPIFWGAPYAPSNISDIEALLAFAQIKPGDVVADLGSGDGRAVILMAQQGAIVTGYEISPLLVLWARLKKWRAPKHLARNITFECKSFWNTDLSKYDVVFLYQLPHVLRQLSTKLQAELKPGARIISNSFAIPNWQPIKNTNRVYMYIKDS
jgi:cyclopropane fatty-acyl-phospholipid synthase-like methyltransferase